jgi:hypothetical protein
VSMSSALATPSSTMRAARRPRFVDVVEAIIGSGPASAEPRGSRAARGLVIPLDTKVLLGRDAEILAPNFGPGSDRIAFPHTRETDCVAGHIGFELRCAERMFISLRNRRASDLRRGAQTFAPSGRIIFSAGLDCLLFACAFVERRTQQQVP